MARCRDGMGVEEMASLAGSDSDGNMTSLSGSNGVGESAPLKNGMSGEGASPHGQLIPPVRICACGGRMGRIQTRRVNYGQRGCGKDCLFPRNLEVRVTPVGVSARTLPRTRIPVWTRSRGRMAKSQRQCSTDVRNNCDSSSSSDAFNSLVASDPRGWVSDTSISSASDTRNTCTSNLESGPSDPSDTSWTPKVDTDMESPSSSSRASDCMGTPPRTLIVHACPPHRKRVLDTTSP